VAGSDWLPAATPLDLAVAACNFFKLAPYVTAQMLGELPARFSNGLIFCHTGFVRRVPSASLAVCAATRPFPTERQTGSVKLLRQS
jgi:hypothetical protein